MSLVAYDASSDEDSDTNDSDTVAINEKNLDSSKASKFNEQSNVLKIEKDKSDTSILFNKLPAPKTLNAFDVQEDDDEFLHKKATPISVEKRPKGPVQITIPSLSEFKDIDEEENKLKTKQKQNFRGVKTCGLLDLLPKPREVFPKTISSPLPTINSIELKESSNKAKLIPDSVKKSQKSQIATTSKIEKSILKFENDDSENSEGEGDFFSLNKNDELPDVSLNEINAMVAKRAAKMAEASSKLNQTLNIPAAAQHEVSPVAESTEPVPEQVNVDEKALHILVGSRAKRRKVEEINVVELSSSEVLPNKDEWLRTALASATQYQPKGVLTDEEPAPGTRKKHQITYLAHQAKANELELQAMWAANRQSRRQTQSKYGF